MKEQKKLSSIIIIMVFLVFTIAMVFVTYYVTNYQSSSSKYFKDYNTKLTNELKTILDNQEQMDERIKEISENGKYTITEPCIIENPYKISPLSAVAIFNTEKEEAVEVLINDKHVTTTEKNTKHIIPIYGLYSHTNNILELRLSDGTSFSKIIKTDTYNFNIAGVPINDYLDDKENFFIIGDINDKYSNLRGFDYNANLIFYLDLDYINGIKAHNDHFFVGYNSKKSNANFRDLKLELDYLGRIYLISTDTSDLNSKANIEVIDKAYIGYSNNMYKDTISNLVMSEVVDTNKYTDKIKTLTSDIESLLDEAKVYDGNFDLSMNGDYLTYDFKNYKDITLAIISRDSTYTYLYDLNDDNNIIKVDLKGDLSLYIKTNDKYYSLLTIINN